MSHHGKSCKSHPFGNTRGTVQGRQEPPPPRQWQLQGCFRTQTKDLPRLCPSPVHSLTPGPALDEFELGGGSSLVVLADLPAHAEAQRDHVVLLAVPGPAALGVVQQRRLQRPALGTKGTLRAWLWPHPAPTSYTNAKPNPNHNFPKSDHYYTLKPNSSLTPMLGMKIQHLCISLHTNVKM